MITENLEAFLQDFGVPCSCGPYAFTGILDQPDEILSTGQTDVISRERVLTCRTSDVQAGGIAGGSAVIANGQPFKVRAVLSQDDGAFSTLSLSK